MKLFLLIIGFCSALALNRDEPSTKNTAPFDLAVLMARKDQASMSDALDSLTVSLGAGSLVAELKELMFEKLAEKFGNSSWADKLPSPLPPIPPSFKEKEIGCKICLAVSKGIKAYTIKVGNYSLFENSIIKACHILFNRTAIRTDVFCDGLIKLQLPHIYGVIDKLRPLQMSDFCPYLNACVPPKAVPPKTVPLKDTSRTQTATRNAKKKAKMSKIDQIENEVAKEDTIRVVQLTDIHFEQNYKENSNTDCGLPVCCLEKYGAGTAGYYGDFKCNIPLRTIQNFLSKVNEMKPDVILYSGDTPPHTMWDETFDSQLSCTQVLTQMIAETMPGITVYPSIGNHESYPTNLFSYNNLPCTKNFTREYFNYWNPIAKFPSDQIDNILKGGFYTTVIREKLRLIVLNSDYWYVFNWYNVLNDLNLPKESHDMQTFLNNELKKARNAGEKVILMSHHVPGNADYIIKFSRYFEEVLVEYSDIIILIPAGHTHLDEFRIMRDSNGVAKSVVLVSPSVTTLNLRNPSMRIFELKSDNSFELLDYQQYYLDLAQMNDYARVNGPISDITNFIKLLYSAKQTYYMPDMSAASWDQLATSFESDHSLLMLHASYSTAVGDPNDKVCLDRCTQRYVCRMRHSNFDEFLACLPGIPTLPANFTLPTLPQITRRHLDLPGREVNRPGNTGSEVSFTMVTVFLVLAILYYI